MTGARQGTVCYCFGHTVESIREEIERTGTSTVVEVITAKIRAGECACETLNPSGKCCLGDVRAVVRAELARAGCAPADARRKESHNAGEHDCCGPANAGPSPLRATR